MMNKKLKLTLKTFILSILIIPAAWFYGCNGYNKKQVNNNKVIKTKENMKLDSNCIIINNISFDKKSECFEFIEKYKKEYYSDGRGEEEQDSVQNFV